MVNTAHAYSLILRTVVVNRVCKTIPNGEIDTQPQREKSTWEREREREIEKAPFLEALPALSFGNSKVYSIPIPLNRTTGDFLFFSFTSSNSHCKINDQEFFLEWQSCHSSAEGYIINKHLQTFLKKPNIREGK